jgi:hypothetical protein
MADRAAIMARVQMGAAGTERSSCGAESRRIGLSDLSLIGQDVAGLLGVDR